MSEAESFEALPVDTLSFSSESIAPVGATMSDGLDALRSQVTDYVAALSRKILEPAYRNDLIETHSRNMDSQVSYDTMRAEVKQMTIKELVDALAPYAVGQVRVGVNQIWLNVAHTHSFTVEDVHNWLSAMSLQELDEPEEAVASEL